MSLINDALKRAQQTQAQNPPPTPPLELRPAEADSHPPRRSALWLVGFALVLLLLLGLTGTLIWYISQGTPAALPAAARPANPSLHASAPNAAPAAPIKPEFAAAAPPVEHPEEPNTNRVPVAAEPPPAAPPPGPKLQGIAFNPQQPSAIINGRTLNLGDQVDGFRLIGISPVAVTLVRGRDTNVLSLSR